MDVGVIDEPDDLIAEQFAVVLRGEVGFRGLRGVQLQALAHALAQNIHRRVGLHDLHTVKPHLQINKFPGLSSATGIPTEWAVNFKPGQRDPQP